MTANSEAELKRADFKASLKCRRQVDQIKFGPLTTMNNYICKMLIKLY